MDACSKILMFSLLAGASRGSAFGEELRVTAAFLGPSKPSPFPAQLQVRVTNESFTSATLLEKIMSSQLLVDGRPLKRADIPFGGPAGLSPKGSWEGCMALENYGEGALTSGTHRLQLKIGDALSEELRVKAAPPAPPADSVGDRIRQVEVLADLISPGLLESCVENWLSEKDGGLQIGHRVRYYLDPGVKILVTYDDAQPEPRVTGRVRMYAESRIED